MKTTINATLLSFAVALTVSTASAQGIFSGLSNRQDEIKKAGESFEEVFSSYNPSRLIKGEMGRKDDGTPDIAIGGDGDVQVAVKLDVDQEAYGKWINLATNTFTKYADHVLSASERLSSEDYGKPKIRVGDTTFVFPNDMESAIDSAKKSRFPQNPHIAVFLVDIDGNVVAEPASRDSEALSVEEDIKLFTDTRTIQNGANLSISDVAAWQFSGGSISDAGLAWQMQWHDIAEKVAGHRISGWYREDRHQLSVESFPDKGPLEMISSWNADFGYKGAKKRGISFGMLSKDKLDAVQDVRVCVGGFQYRNFLKEIKDRAEKESAERKALEED